MSEDSTLDSRSTLNNGHDLANNFFPDSATMGTNDINNSLTSKTIANSEYDKNQIITDEQTSLVEIQQLKKQVEELEKGLKLILTNIQMEKNILSFQNKPQADGVESIQDYEEWLAQWQKDEPDAFMTQAETKKIIANYEIRYNMSSAELLEKLKNGTAPDHYDILDWQTLLANCK